MIYNLEQVKSFLPHRDPFLFVDTVEEITLKNTQNTQNTKNEMQIKDLVDSTMIATYKTKKDHSIFAGHFPGNPILPGVVQIEMMAQASSFILTLIHDDPLKMNLEVALLSVEKAKFRKPILPEMALVIKATIIKARGPFSTYSSQVYCGDVLMSEVIFMASTKFT